LNGTGLRVDDIPEDSSKSFTHQNEQLFAVKKDGKVFVYKNSCPHLWIALNWEDDQFLDSSKSMIQCANHGALFIIENGNCVSGPCNGRKLTSVAFDIIAGVICPR
jgi:nitrite reductase/ring-hydroxylating ferredoxin subunit